MDYLDYSEISKDFKAPVIKNKLVYANLDDFSGVSHAFKTTSSRHTNIIKCDSSSKSDDTYFKDLFSMYPVFFLKNDKWVESYKRLSKDKNEESEIILIKGYNKLNPEIWNEDLEACSQMDSSMKGLYSTNE